MTQELPHSSNTDEEARTWAMVAHLSALVGLLGNGIGFVLGPLAVWLLKKDQYEFVNDQGLEALNFQLTMFITGVAAFVLALTIIGIVIAIPALFLVAIFAVIFPIVAAVKSKQGHYYRYPFTWRLLK